MFGARLSVANGMWQRSADILKKAEVVIEQWRKHYNTIRPHSSLGYRLPAPQTSNPFFNPPEQRQPMQ